MMRRRSIRSLAVESGEGRVHRPDYVFGLTVAVISVLGLIVMYSISPAIAALKEEPSSFYFTRHAMFFAIGIIAFMVTTSLSTKMLKRLIVPLIVASAGISVIVLALGGVGARWVQLSGLSFQPAELIKFTMVISLAYFLNQRIESKEIHVFQKTLRVVLIAVALVAGVMVVLQRDLGSTAVLVAIVGVMLFMAHVPIKPLVIGFLAVVVLASLAIVSTPYRRDRFQTFMNPERDCQTEGYHACQALIAVGSGGLVGLGIQNSVQAYGYLPESATDSIFAIYAEKFGFVGAMILLALYTVLLTRMFVIMQRAPNYFMRLIVAGVIAWIGFQATINIGAMLGLLPLKGITLPLISYGGTSIMFILASLGVVFRISRYTLTRRTLSFAASDVSETRSVPSARVMRSLR